MQRALLTVVLTALGIVLALGTIALLRTDPANIPAVLDSLTRLVGAFRAAIPTRA